MEYNLLRDSQCPECASDQQVLEHHPIYHALFYKILQVGEGTLS